MIRIFIQYFEFTQLIVVFHIVAAFGKNHINKSNVLWEYKNYVIYKETFINVYIMQEVNENHSRRAYFCTTAKQHREWNGNYNYFIFCIATLPMLHSAKKNGLKKQRNKLYLCHKVICESYEINKRWHLKISIVSHDTKESVQKPFSFQIYDI